MDSYEVRDEYTHRKVYSMPSPKPHAEIEKLVVLARREYKKLTGREPADDVPMVRSWDDEIQVTITVEMSAEDFKNRA